MNRETFEQLVAEAVENLSEEFSTKLENIDLVVEWPTSGQLSETWLKQSDQCIRSRIIGLYRLNAC